MGKRIWTSSFNGIVYITERQIGDTMLCNGTLF